MHTSEALEISTDIYICTSYTAQVHKSFFLSRLILSFSVLERVATCSIHVEKLATCQKGLVREHTTCRHYLIMCVVCYTTHPNTLIMKEYSFQWIPAGKLLLAEAEWWGTSLFPPKPVPNYQPIFVHDCFRPGVVEFEKDTNIRSATESCSRTSSKQWWKIPKIFRLITVLEYCILFESARMC